MNPRNHPSRKRVHDALKKLGQGTQRDISAVTGMSMDSIRNTLSRGAPAGYFKRVGEEKTTGRGRYAKVVWKATTPKPSRKGILTPVVGAQQLRDHQQTIRDNHAVAEWDAEDVGSYEVRRTNAHGYTVVTPCSSRSYAELEQRMSGGEIVAIN